MVSKNAPGPSVTEPITTAATLARLVAFDTTSRNPDLEPIDFVRAWLDQNGMSYHVSTNPAGDKANIHAIIGPHTSGGIALSGHVETAPVEGRARRADPFTLRAAVTGHRLAG